MKAVRDYQQSALAILGIVLLLAPAAAPAQAEAEGAREQAQTYFETDEARKAVATLAEAAQLDPQDRTIGAMLYAAIRDHVWHMPQTLPTKGNGAICALTFSPDGARLASGSETGEIVISTTEPLDEEEAEERRIRLKQDGEIAGLTFTKDGKLLVAVSKQGGMQAWDVSTKQAGFSGPKPVAAVTAFAVAGNRESIAIGLANGGIQIFDLSTGKLTTEFQQGGGAVRALALSRSGKKIAAATSEPAVYVWEAATGRSLGKGVAHQAPIQSVDFSSDELYALSADRSGMVWLSNPEEGIAVMPGMDCGAVVKKTTISPDGSMIATVLDDGSVAFWDAISGERLAFSVRENAVLNDFAWTHAGLRGGTASEDGHTALWTMRDGTRRGEKMPHDAPVRVVSFSPDDKLLAAGCADGITRIWRTDGGRPLTTVRTHAARARTAFYSLDGEDLVTTSEDHTALHWRSGHVRPFGPALKHAGKVTCGVFNADATRILTCDDSGIAQLWDAESGHADGPPFRHKEGVLWVDFHPDGQRCVTASGNAATVWAIDQRKQPLAVIRHPGKGKSKIQCARFSPDGKWLVTASTDGTARIWDAATYRAVGAPIQRGFPVLCARFSPDGSCLVVAGEDAQAAVYDTKTWEPVGRPVLAPGPVFSAAITEDNRFLVISSLLLDVVQFFEIETGRPLGYGLAIPTQATCVDYLVADKVVVVACDDGTVRAIEAPFVSQNVPAWMFGFIDRLIGLKKTGEDTFERVNSHAEELRTYVSGAARSSNGDFPKLVRWKLSPGAMRNGMPRFTSTIAANIERRVEERSVDALFECYESLSGDPLILGALSLYLPNRRHGEYLADLVLGMNDASPTARCFAAGTLVRMGRSSEVPPILDKALAEAPNDTTVLRRVAKIQARLSNYPLAVELLERALKIDAEDAEIRRDYGWVLYNFHRPAEAAEQFHAAQQIGGDVNEDLIAGLCLCAAAQKKTDEAHEAFRRLAGINPSWKSAAYLGALRGWTQMELGELERVRRGLFPSKKP